MTKAVSASDLARTLELFGVFTGAFVIAFVVVLFLVGLPLFYLEITLAQYSKKGPADVFKSVPALRGECAKRLGRVVTDRSKRSASPFKVSDSPQ